MNEIDMQFLEQFNALVMNSTMVTVNQSLPREAA